MCVVFHDGVKTYRIPDTIDTEIQSQYNLILSQFSLHKLLHFMYINCLFYMSFWLYPVNKELKEVT